MRDSAYHTRTHRTLTAKLREAIRVCQLRDWDIVLRTGCVMPENEENNLGQVYYDLDTLRATIRVDLEKCREAKVDPLSVLYHEVGHILVNYCTHEERLCNIIATLLMKKKT